MLLRNPIVGFHDSLQGCSCAQAISDCQMLCLSYMRRVFTSLFLWFSYWQFKNETIHLYSHLIMDKFWTKEWKSWILHLSMKALPQQIQRIATYPCWRGCLGGRMLCTEMVWRETMDLHWTQVQKSAKIQKSIHKKSHICCNYRLANQWSNFQSRYFFYKKRQGFTASKASPCLDHLCSRSFSFSLWAAKDHSALETKSTV